VPISEQVCRLRLTSSEGRAHGWGNMALTWAAPGAETWNRLQTRRAPVASKALTGPLKICLISETLLAGVGRHIVDAASALSARGHEVHLLYSPVRMDPQFLSAIKRLPTIRCHPIPMPHGLCVADILTFLQIKEYMRLNGPFDIVHGQSSKGGGYARLLKLFGAASVMYSPHAFVTLSPVVSFLKRLIYQGIEVVLSQLTDTIVCTSHVEQEHARRLGISPSKLTVIVNGSADVSGPDRQTVRATLGLAPEHVVIGFVGRMEDQKAPQRLVEAAMRILPDLPQLRLLMIGDGPKRAFLESRLKDVGLADRALWLGAVDARQYMPAMDIFALPSLYEGFAYVLLEALCTGLPIVSTPVGGTYESILPGVNGIIVPHDSPHEMAAALHRLVTDADLRSSMAQASSKRAAQFSIPRMVDAIETLYFNALSAHPQVAEAAPMASVPQVRYRQSVLAVDGYRFVRRVY